MLAGRGVGRRVPGRGRRGRGGPGVRRLVPACLATAAVALAGCGDGTARTENASRGETAAPKPTEATPSSSSSTSSSSVLVPRPTTTAVQPTTTATAKATATTAPAPTDTTATTVPRTTVTTSKLRAHLPGPPGPKYPNGGPNALSETVDGWYALLKDEVATGSCQPLLLAVQKSPNGTADAAVAASAKAYATLYKGIAEGCLGQTSAATTDLDQATKLLAALDPTKAPTDKSCQPQMLLVWAYDSYLNQKVPLVCPAPEKN
jgi:hypothetical protein